MRTEVTAGQGGCLQPGESDMHTLDLGPPNLRTGCLHRNPRLFTLEGDQSEKTCSLDQKEQTLKTKK